jgi:hypothetical protein
MRRKETYSGSLGGWREPEQHLEQSYGWPFRMISQQDLQVTSELGHSLRLAAAAKGARAFAARISRHSQV